MAVRVTDSGSPVGRLVSRAAVRVPTSASLAQAAIEMRRHNVSCLLVGDDAVVSERDMTGAMAARLLPEQPVSAIASRDPIRVEADMSVVDAAATMLNKEVRHLIVEFDDGHEGVVSIRDVVAVLLGTATPQIWLESLRVAIGGPAEIWLG